jgi:predicted  nucleic acid-binding Zn-ribbon protein
LAELTSSSASSTAPEESALAAAASERDEAKAALDLVRMELETVMERQLFVREKIAEMADKIENRGELN